jgi:tetratricopeptide (TPR) repeat protein
MRFHGIGCEKDTFSAISCLDQAIGYENDPHALNLMGYMSNICGDVKTAIKYYTRAIELKRSVVGPYINLYYQYSHDHELKNMNLAF